MGFPKINLNMNFEFFKREENHFVRIQENKGTNINTFIEVEMTPVFLEKEKRDKRNTYLSRVGDGFLRKIRNQNKDFR